MSHPLALLCRHLPRMPHREHRPLRVRDRLAACVEQLCAELAQLGVPRVVVGHLLPTNCASWKCTSRSTNPDGLPGIGTLVI